MGGYAAFVWPSYGVVAVVLIALTVSSIRLARARKRELALLEEAGASRRRRRPTAASGPNSSGQEATHDA